MNHKSKRQHCRRPATTLSSCVHPRRGTQVVEGQPHWSIVMNRGVLRWFLGDRQYLSTFGEWKMAITRPGVSISTFLKALWCARLCKGRIMIDDQSAQAHHDSLWSHKGLSLGNNFDGTSGCLSGSDLWIGAFPIFNFLLLIMT